MASIHDILRPRVVARLVSQIAATANVLLTEFGMQPGGPNERIVGGRSGEYHVFNNVRSVGLGRAPGTAAGRRARQKVGRVNFTFPRLHEEVPLLYEEIHNFARLGLSDAQRDEAGADYVRKQLTPVAQRLANWRTAMLVGMLRGKLYFHEEGDDWYPDYTATSSNFTVDYQMPAGNLTQLNMLGEGNIIDGSWHNPSVDIPGHLGKIDAAFQRLCGGRLRHVRCGSIVWNHIIRNDYVAAGAGIAQSPFLVFDRPVGTGPDGVPRNEKVGRINSMPFIDFHITDDGLDLGVPGSETFTKHWGDTFASFHGDIGPDNFEMLLGSEPIAEYDNGPVSVKVGADTWSKTSSNPTGHEIFSLDNALPSNYVPSSAAFGTVVF